MLSIRILPLLVLPLAIAVAGCTDADSQSGSDITFVNDNPSSPDADVGQGADHADIGDDEEAANPDVEGPQADVSAPDAPVDPSQWESLDGDVGPSGDDEGFTIGPEDRPARVLLPDDYDESRELPVIFLFHGYSATSSLQDIYFDLSPRRHDRDFIVVLPDGHSDATGQQYWNATDYCCDFYGEEPDDVGYFEELLDELLATFAVDSDRVHLLGYSNGAFLSYRLACEYGSRIASIVGFAGSGHWDDADCSADGTVSVLHIHGSNDAVIYYAGIINTYPSARTMTDRWSERNECAGPSSIDDTISLDRLLWGNETTQRRYEDCPDQADVELWTILGGSHIPTLESDFADRVLDFSLPRTNRDTLSGD